MDTEWEISDYVWPENETENKTESNASSSGAAAPDFVVFALTPKGWEDWREKAGSALADWVQTAGFKPESGMVVRLPPGSAHDFLACIAQTPSGLRDWGKIAKTLPAGRYRVSYTDANGQNKERTTTPDATQTRDETLELTALYWALGQYRYRRFVADAHPPAQICVPARIASRVHPIVHAWFFSRDLINEPPNMLGPAELAERARWLAGRFSASFRVIRGQQLERKNFPLIWRVGRASERPPLLIDFQWGRAQAPKLTLIGKGVCFDSGGLNLKPASGMALMKKDMGGAAHVLALAWMIMAARWDVRLRVLIPAADNMVDAASYRPSDVITARDGQHIEIGDTDAEGRLLLADCLTLAREESPDLIVDFATLTGAARIATGPELPNLFLANAPDSALLDALRNAAEHYDDPFWPMPLPDSYKRFLESSIADVVSAPEYRYGGSILAALFLHRFVGSDIAWVHLDVMGWNLSDRPSKPKGGELQAVMAVFGALDARFCAK